MDFGWEWKEEEKKWIPIMTTLLPAPEAIIHLVKVSARVKKGEFSKFLISRCSDKAFQELSLKKNSTKKKYSFSAKLLDIEVYYTLIVLITR